MLEVTWALGKMCTTFCFPAEYFPTDCDGQSLGVGPQSPIHDPQTFHIPLQAQKASFCDETFQRRYAQKAHKDTDSKRIIPGVRSSDQKKV